MKNTKPILTLVVLFASTLIHSDAAWSLGIRPPKEITPAKSPTPSPTPAATPKPTPKPTPSPTPASSSGQTGEFKPLWIGKHADAVNWGRYVSEATERYGQALAKGPEDVEEFCPMYNRLGHSDQMNFWIQFWAAVTKYESGFNPTSRYVETTMGTDPITGKQVASEGLLQLSYQDERSYASKLPQGVCDFDYSRDSQLAINDIRRTIFDPRTNLTCGIWILNDQVLRKGKIGLSSGVYWAVLKVNGKYTKLPEIQKITKALPFCN
jgi:hypothetical protein